MDKNKTQLYAAYKRIISALRLHRLKVKGWKKIFYASRSTYTCIRQNRLSLNSCNNKEHHYIMIKGSIHHKDITNVNMYAPNIGASKYIKQILTHLKGEIDNTVIVDVNTYFQQ